MTQATSSRRRWLQAGALLGLAVLVLSGCRMQMNFTLKSDDKVDGSIVIAMTAVEASSLEAMGMTVDSLFEQSTGDLEANFGATTIEDYNQDGQTGKKMNFTDVPLNTFDGKDDSNPAGAVKFTRDGDDFVVAGNMDMSGEEMAAAGALGSAFDFSMSVTFPGKVGETNGTVSGNTVTWKLEVGKANTINARGSAKAGGGSSSTALFAVIGIVGVAVIALVVFLVLRGRKQPAAPFPVGEQMPGYPPPVPGYPDQTAMAGHPAPDPNTGPIPGIGQMPPTPPSGDPSGQYGVPPAAPPVAPVASVPPVVPVAPVPPVQPPVSPAQPAQPPVPPVIPPTPVAEVPPIPPTPPVVPPTPGQ